MEVRVTISEDPRDFQLAHLNLNIEVFRLKGNRGRFGLALLGIRLELNSR